ncbi:MAG: 4-hydroxy-tetrahydrodipicolinate reductase [Phycisphaerales bacterium]|nr:4-hydroxy-tetrahydrodipicolinate reductase [Phycisphaerales bacterium]
MSSAHTTDLTAPHHSTSVSFALVGASGRVGTRITALCPSRHEGSSPQLVLRVCARPDQHASLASAHPSPLLNPADARALVTGAPAPHAQKPRIDVVVDFSNESGTIEAISLANLAGSNLLVCTTGLSTATIDALHHASKSRAVMLSSNTSVGVAAVAHAVSALTRAMGPSARVNIFEQHHEMKKDAPSGTAKRLAAAVRAGGGKLLDSEIFSVRAGDIIGEHTVRITTMGETIELTHRATTRDLFALGAIRLASWLAGRAPGMYSVEDTLKDA